MNAPLKCADAPPRAPLSHREPHWNGNGRNGGFGEQLRHQCVLDLDRAREVGGDAAIAAWFRKWDRNIEAAIYGDRA